jgi:hypothetical protein
MAWTRKPQESEGTYRFDGRFLTTRGVGDELSPQEISAIYHEVQNFVKEKNGIDYLQVFTDEDGRKLFFIDQINDEMKKEHPPEHNYCTLMFAHEY